MQRLSGPSAELTPTRAADASTCARPTASSCSTASAAGPARVITGDPAGRVRRSSTPPPGCARRSSPRSSTGVALTVYRLVAQAVDPAGALRAVRRRSSPRSSPRAPARPAATSCSASGSSFVYAVPFAVSILVRRPLVGLAVGVPRPVAGRPGRAGPAVVPPPAAAARLHVATLIGTVLFLARGIVQATLYHDNATGWLAFARIAMGYPLYIVGGRRRLLDRAARAARMRASITAELAAAGDPAEPADAAAETSPQPTTALRIAASASGSATNSSSSPDLERLLGRRRDHPVAPDDRHQRRRPWAVRRSRTHLPATGRSRAASPRPGSPDPRAARTAARRRRPRRPPRPARRAPAASRPRWSTPHASVNSHSLDGWLMRATTRRTENSVLASSETTRLTLSSPVAPTTTS